MAGGGPNGLTLVALIRDNVRRRDVPKLRHPKHARMVLSARNIEPLFHEKMRRFGCGLQPRATPLTPCWPPCPSSKSPPSVPNRSAAGLDSRRHASRSNRASCATDRHPKCHPVSSPRPSQLHPFQRTQTRTARRRVPAICSPSKSAHKRHAVSALIPHLEWVRFPAQQDHHRRQEPHLPQALARPTFGLNNQPGTHPTPSTGWPLPVTSPTARNGYCRKLTITARSIYPAAPVGWTVPNPNCAIR